jgi:putative oxidoreductase
VAQISKALNIILWILQILAAAMFLFAGILKLFSAPMLVENFAIIGLGQWFRYATGIIEVGSAALLLTPRLAAVGAVLLTCTMIGAVIVHLTRLHSSPAVPLVLLVVCVIIVWGRARQLLS